MRGADALVTMLERYGVRHVFGLPGDTSMAFYDALRDSRLISHIVCRDERSAAYMADGYAREAGRPGICEVPSGGGVTHAIPGVAEADASRVPVLLISSDVPVTSETREALTALDDQPLLRAVTRWNAKVRRPEMLPRMVRYAFRRATSGRTGAVHLSIAEDVLSGPAELEERELRAESWCSVYPAFRARPDPSLVERARKVLLSAARPLILAGGGVHLSRAWEELEEFVSLTGIPVVTSINGKGSVAEATRFALGVVGGNGGKRSTNQVAAEADAVLCLGSRLNSTTTAGFSIPAAEARVIQVDIDPAQVGNNVPVEVGMVADIKLALRDLTASLDGWRGNLPRAWEDWSLRARRSVESELEGMARRFSSCELPADPCAVVRVVEDSLPPGTVLVLDAGTPTPYFSAFYRTKVCGRSVIAARGHGALGYSVPAAVGVKTASPSKTVLAVFGDGSFGMVIGELETIVRAGVAVILLHLRNDCYGWIKALQHVYFDSRYHGVDLSPGVSYADIARSLGMPARRVQGITALRDVLVSAQAEGGPVYVEVPILGPESLLPPVEAWERDLQLRPEDRLRRSY